MYEYDGQDDRNQYIERVENYFKADGVEDED